MNELGSTDIDQIFFFPSNIRCDSGGWGRGHLDDRSWSDPPTDVGSSDLRRSRFESTSQSISQSKLLAHYSSSCWRAHLRDVSLQRSNCSFTVFDLSSNTWRSIQLMARSTVSVADQQYEAQTFFDSFLCDLQWQRLTCRLVVIIVLLYLVTGHWSSLYKQCAWGLCLVTWK